MFKKQIECYDPVNEQEANDKRIMLDYIKSFPTTILTRENEFAHFTSSAFIFNKEKTKVLMAYHNIYQSWAWTGGHVDGEDDFLAVAIKEAKEETGITSVSVLSEEIAALDILNVQGHMKKGNYVSAHLHLNAAYLLLADETEPLRIKEDENSAVGWLSIDELSTYCNEPHIIPVYDKLIARARLLCKKSEME